MLWEGYVVAEDISECGVSVLALERCGSKEHFVDKDPQGPPVNCAGVAATLNNFWSNVFFCPNK